MSFFSNRIFKKVSLFKVQLLWAAVSILFLYFIFFVIRNGDRSSHGFVTYYTASKLLLEGESVSNFYNDYWFSSKVGKYDPGIYEIYSVNLPTTSFILLPIASFDYKTARIIWTCFNVIILFITITLITNSNSHKGIWLPIILIIFFVYQPLYVNFSYGQVYILILFLLTLVWLAYRSGKEEWLGIIIGLIFVLKSTTFILWILLLNQKKWKSFGWLLLTIVLIFFVTLPFVGLDSWFEYINKLSNYSSNPSLSVTAYQTVHSFFNHITSYHEYWNPEPIFDLPVLGKSLAIIFSLIILSLTIYNVYKFNKPDLSFGTFIIAGVILNPASMDYHYILIIIPIFILLNHLVNIRSNLLWICFIISFLLIATRLPYISPKVTIGIWALFAYPKLYGAIGLFSSSLIVSYKLKINGKQLEYLR